MAEYEFTEDQNVIINGFSYRLIAQSLLFGVIGTIQFVAALLLIEQNSLSTSVLLILQAIFLFLIAPVFIRPSANLKLVTTTEGSDITEMMKGLKKLSFGFMMIIVLVVLAIVCDILMAVLS